MLQDLPLIFMGTPHFAVPILQGLIDAKAHVAGVYSQPPRPQGRGYKVEPSPVEALARSYNIPVYTPLNFKEEKDRDFFKNLVKEHGVQVAVVAAYGLLLPEVILNAPALGCINVHASLLPRWRGASPIQHAILEGDKETGISIMKMDKGLDTGPVLLQQACPIEEKETSVSLQEKLSLLGIKALLEALELYVKGQIQPEPQPEKGVTYAPKIPKEAGKLDFYHKSAYALERQIRAFTPWPGSFFEIEGERIKVLEASVQRANIPFMEKDLGKIVGDELEIMCADGILFCPHVVQKSGGKPLDIKSFLRGFPLLPGMYVNA